MNILGQYHQYALNSQHFAFSTGKNHKGIGK
jgi:hypothetical protein